MSKKSVTFVVKKERLLEVKRILINTYPEYADEWPYVTLEDLLVGCNDNFIFTIPNIKKVFRIPAVEIEFNDLFILSNYCSFKLENN